MTTKEKIMWFGLAVLTGVALWTLKSMIYTGPEIREPEVIPQNSVKQAPTPTKGTETIQFPDWDENELIKG